jgi:hypothetical protein
MPPRTKKVKTAAAAGGDADTERKPAVELPPVIFFLKVRKDFIPENSLETSVAEQPIGASAGGAQEYSDVLRETQDSATVRFDESVIHELISKIQNITEYREDTVCFNDCHAFCGTAFCIPTHYESYTNTYGGEGNFCSPECCLTYIYSDSKLTESEKWYRHSLVESVYGKLYPAGNNLHLAPDRRVLRIFGGNLDIQQYRELIRHSTKPLQLSMAPIRLYMPSVNTQVSARDVKSYVSLTAETVQKASQQLRLRRSKPVYEGTATLDKCISVGNVLK